MEEASTLPVQVLSMMIGVFAMVCVVFVYGIRSVTPPASHFQAFDDNTGTDKKSKKQGKKKKQTPTQNGPAKSPRVVTDKGHQTKAANKPVSPAVKEPAKPTKKKTKSSEVPAVTTSKSNSKSAKVVEADYADAGWTVVSKKEPKQNKQPASPKAVESLSKPSQQESAPKGDVETPPKQGKKVDATSKEANSSNGQGKTNATSAENTGAISPQETVKSSPKKSKAKGNQDGKSKDQKAGDKTQQKKKGEDQVAGKLSTKGKDEKGKDEKGSAVSKGKEKQASPKKEKNTDDEWIIVKSSDKKGSPKPAEISTGKSRDEGVTLSSKGRGKENQPLPKEEDVDNGWVEVKGSFSPASKKKTSPKPKASSEKTDSSPQPSKDRDLQVPYSEPQLQAVKEKGLEMVPSEAPSEGGDDVKKGKKKGKKGPTSTEPQVNGVEKNAVQENGVKETPTTEDKSSKAPATKGTEKQSKDSQDAKDSTSPSEESTKKGKKKQKNKSSTPASPSGEKKETSPADGSTVKEATKKKALEKKESDSGSPAKIVEPKATADESKGTEIAAGAESEKTNDSWQEAKPQKKKKKVRKDV